MTIQEAVRSGRRFRRKDENEVEGRYCDPTNKYSIIRFVLHDEDAIFTVGDLTANDWITEGNIIHRANPVQPSNQKQIKGDPKNG